ncbi:MAG: hypothetical protein IKI01_07755 [Lachnospiraceae bacterium]|nr:hypothetical protein [Lachnospiraceae bacterium]
MKRRKICAVLSIVIAVMCGLFVYCGRGEASKSKSAEKHKITVEGGYALDDSDNPIQEAVAGASVHLMPELTAGTYVYEWKVDGETIAYRTNYYFVMPDKDVTVTAVRKNQEPYVIDLTGPARLFYDEDKWRNTIQDYIITVYKTDYNGTIVSGILGSPQEDPAIGIDVDGDGTKDMVFVILVYQYNQNYIVPKVGGSARGDFKLDELNNLPYWPITIRFGSEPVKSSYSVQAENGKAFDEKGNEITTARPGELVTLEYTMNPDTYLKEWKADGIADFHAYYYTPDQMFISNTVGQKESFVMPAMDMTIHAVTGQKTPYTVDFRNGEATVPFDVYLCIAQAKQGTVGEAYLETEVDLDDDGTIDFVQVGRTQDEKTVWIPATTCSIKNSYTLEAVNAGAYWPIQFLFPEVAGTYQITVNGGHAEDENGKVITQIEPGKKVRVKADYTEGHYWKSWESDCDKIIKNQIHFDFIMPARDVTITAQTVSSQTPYTIDLTERDNYKDAEIVINMILAQYGYPAGINEFDLDGNGSNDIFCWSWYEDYGMEWNGNIANSYFGRCKDYSLWKEATIEAKNGPYGPITFVVDVDKVNARPEDEDHISNPEELKYYSVTVIDGKAKNQAWEIVTRAKEGTKLYLYPDYVNLFKLSHWEAEGIGFYQEVYYVDEYYPYYFIMPAHDVTIKAVYEEKTTPTPTPTVTPTSTPTPTGEPTTEPTVEPTEQVDEPAKTSEKKDNSSFHPLYIIIPAGVLLFGGVTAVLLVRRKKRASKGEVQ